MSEAKPANENAKTPAKAPAEGRKPGKRGRKTRLTDAIQQVIVSAIKAGNYLTAAAEFAGVAADTVHEWIRRGEGRDKRPASKKYAEFAAAIKEAEAWGAVSALKRIQDAARGKVTRTLPNGKVEIIDYEEETVTRKLLDGTTETRVTKRPVRPIWQADAWWLERRFPKEWGRHDRIDHASPGSDRVEHNVEVEALLDKIYGEPPDEQSGDGAESGAQP